VFPRFRSPFPLVVSVSVLPSFVRFCHPVPTPSHLPNLSVSACPFLGTVCTCSFLSVFAQLITLVVDCPFPSTYFRHHPFSLSFVAVLSLILLPLLSKKVLPFKLKGSYLCIVSCSFSLIFVCSPSRRGVLEYRLVGNVM
jgi:hypothetical protein